MSKKIGTGVWFIFAGIIILLHNLQIISFNFYALVKYWPLVIVSVGINLMFQNKKNGGTYSFALNLVLCLFLTYIGITSSERMSFKSFTSNGELQDSIGSMQVKTPFKNSIEAATLEFNLGASSLHLDSVSSQNLVEASSENNNISLVLNTTEKESLTKVEINSAVTGSKDAKNKINLTLNSAPIWKLEFNLGAANFAANLTPYKFSNLEINAGASAMDLKLGMPHEKQTKIEINTAASSCKIAIPKDAACRVQQTSVMSSRKLDGFEKDEDYYKTRNYDQAARKYDIEINGAAISLAINRY